MPHALILFLSLHCNTNNIGNRIKNFTNQYMSHY